jgi:hypothetical protein
MPNYNFRNNTTGEEWTEFMTNSEREHYLKYNPNVEQIFTTPIMLGDPVALGVKTIDKGFRDVLKNVQKHHSRGKGINFR